jgi:hypothetical protein
MSDIAKHLESVKAQWARVLDEALAHLFTERTAFVLLKGRTYVATRETRDALENIKSLLDPAAKGDWKIIPAVVVYERQKRVRRVSLDSPRQQHGDEE